MTVSLQCTGVQTPLPGRFLPHGCPGERVLLLVGIGPEFLACFLFGSRSAACTTSREGISLAVLVLLVRLGTAAMAGPSLPLQQAARQAKARRKVAALPRRWHGPCSHPAAALLLGACRAAASGLAVPAPLAGSSSDVRMGRGTELPGPGAAVGPGGAPPRALPGAALASVSRAGKRRAWVPATLRAPQASSRAPARGLVLAR